ncbi:MAG: magnesium and cobalt transport protein CorA [Flavobacteriales bacterium]|nr:magnesium and cobalt transport protein CorA [Flavobacteriales bacterium]
MMVIHARQGGRMVELTSADALRSIPVPDVVWIDLEGPTELEVKATETFIGTELMTPTEAAEIESSSRYFEEPPAEFHLNTHFLQPGEHGWRPEPVTFAMRNQVLVTRRSGPLRSFTELARRRKLSAHAEWTGYDTFLSLFDLRIDEDADLVEQLSRDIIVLNKDLNLNTTVGKDLLLRIDELLDKAMVLRANIVDKQRTLSAVLKSEGFPTDHHHGVHTLLKDIDSLLEHITFGFERLEFLQNTALGLVNIDQNKVIKIFTVATLIFMPPTLIASIYGMNFRHMPELHHDLGYPLSIALMVLSSGGALLVFRRKGWL